MNLLEGHVLVVDDLESNRDALVRILHREGLTTEEASNGQEALACLRNGSFDTVLLDVMMPVLDGVQTLGIIKEDSQYGDVPVIMLSAHQDAQAVRLCIELGADDYLPKPIDRLLLRARLTACLRRKHFKDRERDYLTRLEATNEELRRLNQFKSRVLAVAAHDLKSPMTAMLLVLDQSVPGEDGNPGLGPRSGTHDQLRESLQQMLGILQALLDSAAFEAGDYILSRQPTDLGALAQGVLDDNMAYGLSKDIVLLFARPEEDLSVVGDPTRLREAVDNLVNNAIKFSPPGTQVHVALEEELRDGQRTALLRVQDQGPGLTEEDHRQAFGIYQRLSARPTGDEVSTGLGLSIVKQMVELHGGRVWAEPKAPPGATFCLELPLEA